MDERIKLHLSCISKSFCFHTCNGVQIQSYFSVLPWK